MKVEETKNRATGTMKTIKKGRERKQQAFSSVFFSVFPECKCIRLAAVPQPIRNIAICSCKWVSACFLERRQQSLRFFGPAPFTQVSLLYMFQRDFLVPAGNCFSDKPSNFRLWVQGCYPWSRYCATFSITFTAWASSFSGASLASLNRMEGSLVAERSRR